MADIFTPCLIRQPDHCYSIAAEPGREPILQGLTTERATYFFEEFANLYRIDRFNFGAFEVIDQEHGNTTLAKFSAKNDALEFIEKDFVKRDPFTMKRPITVEAELAIQAENHF